MEKAASETLVFRKERKFVISGNHTEAIEMVVKSHPAFFRRAYPQRWVNNIYFDTSEYQNYRENVVGSAERQKYRIRWYGEQFGHIAKPVLEVKIKRGLAGTKRHFRLPPFELGPGFSQTDLKNILEQSQLPGDVREDLHRLSPTLLNRYRRKYFLTADKKFRLTLDFDLNYIGISRYGNAFLQKSIVDTAVIMELKYDCEHDREAGEISGHFPFRLSRNSKYVNGINQLTV